MDGIRAWAAALCVVAVGCALLQMFAPKGGLGRIYKLLIAAFFLCCMIAPLLGLRSLKDLNLNLLPEEVSADLLQERVNGQLERQIDAALQRVTEDTLKNYQIEVQKVAAHTDTSADGRIYIRQVTLYLDKQNGRHALQARQVMEQRLGVEVVVEEAE